MYQIWYDNNFFCGSHGWSANKENAFPFSTDDDAFEAMDDMGLNNAKYCLQPRLLGWDKNKIEGPVE